MTGEVLLKRTLGPNPVESAFRPNSRSGIGEATATVVAGPRTGTGAPRVRSGDAPI